MNEDYWYELDNLVASNGFTVERAKGTVHPIYTEYTYPLDYGYIPETTSSDGAEIDAWQGSGSKKVTGIVATYDGRKRDMEIKVLIGCSKQEKELVLAAHRRGSMKAILIHRV